MISVIVVALPLEVFLETPPVLAGLIEEPAKVIALIIIAFMFPNWLISKKKCSIFGGLAGLGFAFTENLWYYLGFIAQKKLSPEVIYGRTLLSLPFHIFASALVGMGLIYIAGKGREGYKNAVGLLFVAIVLHGLWNAGSYLGWYIFILIAAILVFGYIYKKTPEYPVPEGQIGVLIFPKHEVWITRDRTFGRDDFKNEVSSEDLQHISRKHFKITRLGVDFFIEDCGSKGGTRLDGTEIKGKGRQRLREGSVITLPVGLTLRFSTIKVGITMMPTLIETKRRELIPKNAASAKLILPDKQEIEINEKEREFGREDFKDAVPIEKLRFISRKHFKITRVNEEFYIEDIGSTNGTMLNGEEIKGLGVRKLKNGDEILVAKILKIGYVER
jgi:pSer/pThr/pTyr-binding forkhead associated (FHA) protein